MKVNRWLSPALIAAAIAGSVVALPAGATSTHHSVASKPFGIDVSDWQHKPGHSIDWEAVASHGVSFAFIKATEGRSFVSPTFADDWESAAAVGILRGAYHFARPSQSSATEQARHFVAVVGRMRGHGVLPPVLDLEESGGFRPQRLIDWVGRWLHVVQHLTGRHPIVYSYPAFWAEHMDSTTRFRYERLWGACYCSGPTTLGNAWNHWNFWQSSSSGRVAGITGRVDVDHFSGTTKALRQLANLGHRTTFRTLPKR